MFDPHIHSAQANDDKKMIRFQSDRVKPRGDRVAHVGYTGTDSDRERCLEVGIWLRRNDMNLYHAWFEAGSEAAIEEDFIDLNDAPRRDFLCEDYCYEVVITHNVWGQPDGSEIGGVGPAACSPFHGAEQWRKRLHGSGARYIFLFGPHFHAGYLGPGLPGYDCYFVPSTSFMTALVSDCVSGRLPAADQDISFRDMASARLERLPELLDNRSLDLSYTDVSGTQLALLKKMAYLEDLRLVGTRITDNDLPLIGRCPTIRRLNLDSSGISGAGLKYLTNFQNLEALSLNETELIGSDLKYLTQFSRLQWLSLLGTSIGDDGLQHLNSIKTLRTVILVGTRVTAEGAARLRRALPHCNVDSRE